MKSILFLASLFLAGCASVSVTSYQEDRSLAPNRIPNKITMRPAKAVFSETSKNTELHAHGVLSETLYLEPKTGHPVSIVTPPAANGVGIALSLAATKQLLRFVPSQCQEGKRGTQEILLDCRIISQRKGSRALRTLVGLGFGKTYFETKTHVYNTNKSSKTPWLVVWTVGGSGRQPGAVFAATPGPVLALNGLALAGTVVSLVDGSGKGLTQDAKRTGKTLGSFVLEKLRESGQPIKRLPVKYLNSVPVPLTDSTIHVPFTKMSPHEGRTAFQ